MSSFNSMVGKSYLYRGNEHKIRSVELNGDGRYVVKTDRTEIKLSAKEIRKEMLPIERGETALVLDKYTIESRVQMGSLSDVLMREIEKLQTDPKRIDQARAISETARTLIELKKTEIEMLKLAKDFGR